jgi:hypothetical protein
MTIQTSLACPLPAQFTPRSSDRFWEKLADVNTAKIQPSVWVKLRNPPTAFSFDEAWLLCECGEDEWLAWIPDYGEIVLSAEEFHLSH